MSILFQEFRKLRFAYKIYAVLRAREISVLSGLRVFIDDFGANGLSENIDPITSEYEK